MKRLIFKKKVKPKGRADLWTLGLLRSNKRLLQAKEKVSG